MARKTSFSQISIGFLGALALLALCAGQAGADLLSLSITSATNWKQSTQVDYNDAVPWGGVSSLPAPGTFTLPTEAYTGPHVQSVGWGATTLYAGPGVRYFQGLLNIPEVASIAADLGVSVDNDVEIYINRHLLVREGSLDPENFGAPHLSVSLGFAGQVDNGSFGNQPFDWAAPTFPATNWISGGINEVILVVRNLSGTDSGGFSFVMNITAKTNNPPVANSDAVTTSEDTPIYIDVLANDSDPDGDALSLTAVTQGTKGTATITTNQTVRYTPTANLNGSDSFTYTVSDGKGGTATATVAVTILPVNDPPSASNDAVTTNEDTPIDIAVLANDSDLDGDALNLTVTQGTRGTAVINANKTVRYTPNANLNGSDSFTYTVSDGKGGTATATVAVTIIAVNDPPVASNDAVTINEDPPPLFINVLANDTDPDGDQVTLSPSIQGTGGSWTYVPPQSADQPQRVRYSPSANFNGSASCTYTISDGKGGTATGTVTVTVLPVNDLPVARNDAVPVIRGQSVTIDVKANDSDVDGDALVVSSVSAPAKGTAVISGGRVVYTSTDVQPKLFFELDSFTYTLSDGQGGSATATVSVQICNPTPNLSVPEGPLAIKQGMGIGFTVRAIDPTTGNPVWPSPQYALPAGAAFDGTTFGWTPYFDQAGTYTVYFQAQTPASSPIAKSVAVSVSANRYPDLVVGGSRDFLAWVPNYTYSEESINVGLKDPKPERPYPLLRIEPVYDAKGEGILQYYTYTFSKPTLVGYTPSFTGPEAGVEVRQKYPRSSSAAFRTFSGSNGFQRAQALPAAFGAFVQGQGNTRPAIGNLDGVGLSEFVVGGGWGSAGQLAVYSPTGGWTKTVQVNWPGYNAYNGETRPAVGDLNGDGKAEIVVGLGRGGWGVLPIFGWEGTDLISIFTLNFGAPDDPYNQSNGETWPALGDLNGDGKADLVVGRGNGGWFGVYVSSPEGHVFRGWLAVRVTPEITFWGATRPAVGDLDGDGKAEIVVAHPAGPAGSGASSPGIAIFSSEGVQVAYLALNWPNGIGVPAIGDVLTPDGMGEIVVCEGETKNLHSFNVTRHGTAWSISPGAVIETGKNNPIPAFGTIAGTPQ